MTGLAAELDDLMVRGVMGISRFRLLIAYWEKRGELGPYPRDGHGHRWFVPADLPAIRARLTRWHTEDKARAAKYWAKPEEAREGAWTRRARRRHGLRHHAGPFAACEDRLCHPYTPQVSADRMARNARIRAQR